MSTLSLFTSSASSHILLFSCGRLTNLHHIDLLPMNVKSNGNSQLFVCFFISLWHHLISNCPMRSKVRSERGGRMCSLKMFKTSLLHFAFTFGTSVVHLSWDTEAKWEARSPGVRMLKVRFFGADGEATSIFVTYKWMQSPSIWILIGSYSGGKTGLLSSPLTSRWTKTAWGRI